jgi:Tfp pilus assembly protein PilF
MATFAELLGVDLPAGAGPDSFSLLPVLEGRQPKDKPIRGPIVMQSGSNGAMLIRAGDWQEAERQLDLVPPTLETYERYRLEAMVADSNQEWDRADHFYEIAVGLTTRPANVLNNWGFSRLSRGDFDGAEALFLESIRYDPDLFTAKNNLVMARAAQGNYQMPLVRMSEIERAQLLHTAALAAIRQGQTDVGRGLLAEAIETHPQHFEAAVRALDTLETEVRG